MNTTAVHIDTQLYNNAAEYARRQHTSVDKMLENYILMLTLTPAENQKFSKFSPVVERLGNLHLKEFTEEQLDEDPRLKSIMTNDEE